MAAASSHESLPPVLTLVPKNERPDDPKKALLESVRRFTGTITRHVLHFMEAHAYDRLSEISTNVNTFPPRGKLKIVEPPKKGPWDNFVR